MQPIKMQNGKALFRCNTDTDRYTKYWSQIESRIFIFSTYLVPSRAQFDIKLLDFLNAL